MQQQDQGRSSSASEKADKAWDESFRSLFRLNPQAFIRLVQHSAHSLEHAQAQGVLPTRLKSWKLEVDGLTEVQSETGAFLAHFEFQAYHDATMPMRLLRYNVLIRSEYTRPVSSCVIYLLKDGNVPVSPLVLTSNGQTDIVFQYVVIALSDLTPEEVLALEEPVLLPLLPFTQGGVTQAVTETMFDRLEGVGDKDLLSIAATTAGLMFHRDNPARLDWLKRKLFAMESILRESPFVQDLLAEGREKGLLQGREEGLLQGRELERQTQLASWRETILELVLERFPSLIRLARQQVVPIDDMAILRHVLLKLSLVQTAKEAKQFLLKMHEAEED